MCGICGIALGNQADQSVDLSVLQRMAEIMRHRGPDSDGYHISLDQRVGLGFRRLSIIDLHTGDQPLANEDGSIWTVFNGEIYNFRELRKSLEAKGHGFRTKTDTEVIVHAYEEFSENFVEYLRGMFAIAIWDKARHRLVLARDRLGKKPLFYYIGSTALVFASEIKALLKVPEVPREIDPTSLDLYLTYGYVPAPWCILRDARKLPPAHLLVLDLEHWRSSIKCYWEPRAIPKLDIPAQEAEERLLKLLKESVALRMESDVPLGALLSGGIDSSLVVSLMAECSDRPVKTFTIGFEEQGYDERRFASLVAKRYDTDHHELIVRPEGLNVLPKLAWFLDEPMADASALPTYYVAQMARRHVTVVLNGDGGDENFGGYWHHGAALRAERLGRIITRLHGEAVRPPLEFLSQRSSVRALARISRLVEEADRPFWAKHESRVALYSPLIHRQLLAADGNGHNRQSNNYFEATYRNLKADNEIDALLQADLLTVLPGQLLVKMDRMTMAHSLEARSPLLDHRVVEFAASLPAKFKIDGSNRKILLRRLAGKYLPSELINRPKMGFAVPLQDWLGHDHANQANEILVNPSAKTHDLLNQSAVRILLASHQKHNEAAGAQIWGLLVLEFWLKEVLG
jgi:asparagine synthase (glutamine-hydrolysing)